MIGYEPTDEEVKAWAESLEMSEEATAQMFEESRWLPVIPSLDVEHTDDSPFCDDETCPCADDLAAIEEQEHHLENGLLTYSEFVRILHGVQL